jgi:hypothetical protein
MDQTLCEKIPLDRRVTDRLIQFGQRRIVGSGRVGYFSLAFGAQRGNLIDHRLFARTDLAGVDAVASRQLRDRAVLTNRLQCHLRLEINPMLFANIRHS